MKRRRRRRRGNKARRKGERIDIDIYSETDIYHQSRSTARLLLLLSPLSFSPLFLSLSLSLSLCVPLHTLTFFFCVLSCFFCLLSGIDRMYRVRSRMKESLIIDLVCSSYSFNIRIWSNQHCHGYHHNHHTHSSRSHYRIHSSRSHYRIHRI